MTPEQKAREAIDQRLAQSGWILQDMSQLNPVAGPGVAVREFPTSTGPVDYALFVDGTPVGVVKNPQSGRKRTGHHHRRRPVQPLCRQHLQMGQNGIHHPVRL